MFVLVKTNRKSFELRCFPFLLLLLISWDINLKYPNLSYTLFRPLSLP